jgi:type IV pilus assembly protein PilC
MARKKLTNMYISALCLEIYMMLNSGIAIAHCVEIMLDDEPDIDGKMVLQNLSDNLAGGVPLSLAMKNAEYFPQYMIKMIEIGEKTGRLTEALKALSEYYEGRERIYVAVKNAALYPAVMLAMMVVVVMILIIQVLPVFNDVFSRIGAQMPPFAVRLMNFGAWFRGASVIIAGVFFILFVMTLIACVIPGVREVTMAAADNLWGNKGIFKKIAMLQFVSSMSMALASGINIEESVNLAASLNNNRMISKKYEKCIALIRAGNTLSNALKDTGILSPRDGRILSLGDKSGSADTSMAEIARRCEIMVRDEISSLVGKIEPTLVFITSAIVGIILLSVMLPLMGIMTTIG